MFLMGVDATVGDEAEEMQLTTALGARCMALTIAGSFLNSPRQ